MNGLKRYALNYIAQGEGAPVILIHGMASSLHGWELLVPLLVESGYRAYAVDLLGHGNSEKPDYPDAYRFETVYQALEELIESLPEQSAYILVGHSLGGRLSLEYALRHPQRTRSLVLIDPVYHLNQLSPLAQWLNYSPDWGVKVLQVVPLEVIDFFLGWDPIDAAHFSPEARYQIAVDYKRASPHILQIPHTIPSLTGEQLAQIAAPTLVIWGERDLTLDTRSFSLLVSAMPNAVGCPISGCGHQPHIGKPQLVNRLILEFIGRKVVSQWAKESLDGG